MIMAISAVNSDGTGGPSANKWFSMHSLEVYPLPWLTFSVFESIVWGPQFDLLYALPFASYYYAEGLDGFPNNAQIGLTGSLKFPSAVRADFILFVDDASFNDLIKFHFDTKIIATLQAGVSWTPNLPWLTRLSLNGIMITPYTYSHTNFNGDLPGAPNYLDYTNAGQNMGPSLDPDSARLELNALFTPDPILDIDSFVRAIFHGNASTDASPPYAGTGTIFDNGYATEAFNTFHFLSQSVIEKTIQAGFDSHAYLKTSIGKLEISLSYTFEYILDAGLVAGATAINNYLGMEVKYSY